MSRPRQVALTVGAVVVVIVAVATAVGVEAVRRPWPQTDGTVRIDGLAGQVDVYRDGFGVAHVYADTIDDLFAAQGFVHAQDRFWEMDVRRHTTAGRLAELFGAGQIDTDRVIRTMGWRRVAERELDLLRPESRPRRTAQRAIITLCNIAACIVLPCRAQPSISARMR